MNRTHVVVVGGGYAGTLAANHLRIRPDVDVTLVNPRPVFVERIRLHQQIAGTGHAAVDYATLLGDGVQLVVDTAHRIDAADRQLVLASGRTLAYDYLVYAAGSNTAAPEFAYPIGEFEQAKLLRKRLDTLPEHAPITVVGAGLTGIEIASELAEQGRAVTLACGGVLGPSLGASGRRSVAKALAHLGVTVRETPSALEVRPDAVRLDDGTTLPSALTVWTAGFGVAGLAAASGLTTDALGRLCTDETLTSVDDERIVAAGDAAAPSGHPLRMSCQAAMPLGAQAANTVLNRITGTEPAVLDQGFASQCISLGRRRGTVQFTRRDDTPVNVIIGGRPAAAIKEALCRGTVWALRREAAKPGSYFWLRGGKRPAAAALETTSR